MILTFVLFSALFSLIQAFPSSKNPSNTPFLSLFATQSGTVPLMRDNFGIYANVDLNSFFSDASDTTPNSETVPVIVGLYTNKTILTSNCLSFSSYNCTNPLCNPFTWVSDTRYLPHFHLEGYQAFALAYLDYNYWALSDMAVIATSCTSGENTTFGSSRHGIVGLGFGPSATNNYLGYQGFSVYINKDQMSGQLNFGNDTTPIAPGSRQISLFTDDNWHIYRVSLFRWRWERYYFTSDMIFDLSSDTIGLPLWAYRRLMTFLKTKSIKCNSEYIRPTCTYSGSLKDLPDIDLYVQWKRLPITPQIYLNKTAPGESITLNFRALSPDLTGECYVTEDYRNYIILDINFMTYYYVQFFYRAVTINLAGSLPSQPATSSNTWIFIVTGVLGLVIAATVVCCCYAYRRKKIKIKSKQTSLHEQLTKSTVL